MPLFRRGDSSSLAGPAGDEEDGECDGLALGALGGGGGGGGETRPSTKTAKCIKLMVTIQISISFNDFDF